MYRLWTNLVSGVSLPVVSRSVFWWLELLLELSGESMMHSKCLWDCKLFWKKKKTSEIRIPSFQSFRGEWLIFFLASAGQPLVVLLLNELTLPRMLRRRLLREKWYFCCRGDRKLTLGIMMNKHRRIGLKLLECYWSCSAIKQYSLEFRFPGSFTE